MRGLSPWLLGFSLVVGLGFLHHFAGTSSEPGDTPEIGMAADDAEAPRGDAVLIVEVESRDLLERLRGRFPREKLLVSERNVVAVEGCIFAYGLEAVSGPLNRLGWADRPLDLVSRQRGAVTGNAPANALAPGPNVIADLARKSELTRRDAMALLDQLETAPLAPRR
jgi:hypothetical protein